MDCKQIWLSESIMSPPSEVTDCAVGGTALFALV